MSDDAAAGKPEEPGDDHNPGTRLADDLAKTWVDFRDAVESWGGGFGADVRNEPRSVRYTSMVTEAAALSGQLAALWVRHAWTVTRSVTDVANEVFRRDLPAAPPPTPTPTKAPKRKS